ncbi:hypothetical protein Btru_064273 [Bulinus truncatus]|nr:hypothetical protein Btru_064273 [Bulinus truncatus]
MGGAFCHWRGRSKETAQPLFYTKLTLIRWSSGFCVTAIQAGGKMKAVKSDRPNVAKRPPSSLQSLHYSAGQAAFASHPSKLAWSLPITCGNFDLWKLFKFSDLDLTFTMSSAATSVNVLDVKDDFFSAFRFKAGPVIGSGMTGQVVLATHVDRPEIKLAVKIFITSTEDGGRKSKKLFAREAKAMHDVNHPNLMKMFAAVRCPHYLAITMPYYQKASLSSKLKELMPSHLALYFTQLACAVSYLCSKRIVHSDVKPSNILVDDKDNAILADFGVAFTVAPDEEVVLADRVGGTPAFMAPELFDSKCVDPFKLDIFSLGAVVWCMLFQVEPKSTMIFDYLHETNISPDVPDPYRWALPAMLDPAAQRRVSITQLLTRLKDARFCSSIIDSLTGKILSTLLVTFELGRSLFQSMLNTVLPDDNISSYNSAPPVLSLFNNDQFIASTVQRSQQCTHIAIHGDEELQDGRTLMSDNTST